MNPFLLICSLLLWLVSPPLSAQIADRSISFGFVATPHAVKPLGNDHWLVTGRGWPYRGAFFLDTLFAVIFDQQGEILLKRSLVTPSAEAHELHTTLALADGAFLVAFSLGDCDAGGYAAYVQKYDPDGQLIWTLEGDISNGIKPPTIWRVTPDGNLLGLDYDKMWKVNAATGSVLWRAEFQLNGHEVPYSFDLLPGTEDFLGIASSNFQVWKKVSTPTGQVYSLQSSVELEGYWKGLGFAPNGLYYALDQATDEVKRFDQSLDHEPVGHPNGLEGLIEMAAVEDGLYFLGRYSGQNWLRKTDFLGQNPLQLPMPDRWLSGYSLAVRGDSVAVVGTDGSGPKSTPGNPSYAEFQALQLWLRTFNGLAPTLAGDTPNAAVTDLQQLSGVDTMSFSGGWSYYFNLHGGDFRTQVTNLGNTLLEQVYVNFSYEENNSSFCFSTPAVQHLYTNLQLAPGESTWITFGDLGVQGQSGLASEFCFWTSAPNGRPDARHEDDHYCLPAVYTVATHTPSYEPVKLWPNPAQDYFRVTNTTDWEGTAWQLFDTAGRLVRQGTYVGGQSELSISTVQMPNGFYIFKMDGHVGKLVVRH